MEKTKKQKPVEQKVEQVIEKPVEVKKQQKPVYKDKVYELTINDTPIQHVSKRSTSY